MQFRHEVKHEISNHDMLILRQRLRAVMKPDSHTVNGRYEIRSLYFDNLDDKALREKLNGGVLGLEAMVHTMGYENRLFNNTKVHTIDIVMDDWDEFIANATSEEYYTAAMVIDGEAYKNVGIRGKGNTSLSTVSSMNSDRYSFKVEFDHYDNSITYHGLDKLSLNNLIQDTTMMKDYLTYTMMNEFGAVAPLCSFVYITVNGEDWGLYLAVEGVEDSFLERNYGKSYGELYKPDSMSFGGGRGNGKDFDMDDFMNREKSVDGSEQGNTMPGRENFDPSTIMQMPDGNRSSGINGMGRTVQGSTNLIWLVVSVLVLGVGLLLAKLYKKY